MEIILKRDVENVGFKDDLVTVKNGYGRNYLIPKGLAVLATPSARKVLQETLKQRAFKEQKLVEDAKVMIESLKSIEPKIMSKSGAEGKLFGSVTNADLSSCLGKQGISIDKKFIKIIGGAIKRVGKYTASLRLHRDVIVEITFEVAEDISKNKK